MFEHFSTATHNGCITISNRETGEHRTFRIRTQPTESKFAPGKRVVSLLTGPDNSSDYRGFGFVNDDGSITVWRKKRTPVFETYARMLVSPERYTDRCDYDIEGRCRKCNRKLTVPESIRTGIGPVCAGRERPIRPADYFF